jgi:hypothetical protein
MLAEIKPVYGNPSPGEYSVSKRKPKNITSKYEGKYIVQTIRISTENHHGNMATHPKTSIKRMTRTKGEFMQT